MLISTPSAKISLLWVTIETVQTAAYIRIEATTSWYYPVYYTIDTDRQVEYS